MTKTPYSGPDAAWREESRRKHESGLAPLITQHLMTAACRRAPGKRGFCGRYLSIVAERLELKVLTRFSARELYALAALLRLRQDAAALQDMTAEQKRNLLMRARNLIPAVRRTTGVRVDGDDVCQW